MNQMWGYLETNPEVISEFDKVIKEQARVDLNNYLESNPHLMYGRVKDIANPESAIPFVGAIES